MIKRLIKSLLKNLGYRISRINNDYPHFEKLIPPPWNEYWFKIIYNKIKNATVVSPDRCYILRSFALYALGRPGDFAECGCYKGGTAYLIAETISPFISGRKLYLFDTFKGMPDIAIKSRDSHSLGDFGDTSLDAVKEYLKEFTFIHFYPGIIPQTFQEVLNCSFSFVHIDVDLYLTTLACCEFFYQRLVKGGILICDDYGFKGYEPAAKAAIDNFFKGKFENIIYLPTGQCIVFKK